jgi:hypothetical protein
MDGTADTSSIFVFSISKSMASSTARETVEELSLDAIRGVTDFSRLGFSKEGKKLVYTPAIIVDDTSAEIQQKNKRLQERKTAKRNICIRYLGVEYKYALDYQYISKNQWERLSGDGITVDKEDERRLQTHLKRISGHAEFTNKSSYDNALNLKTEELAIRECWKRVSMQQHEKKAANEDHKLSASNCNTTDLPPHVSQDSQDEEECLQRDDATHAKSSQLDDGSVSAESSDDDSDDDEDNEKASKLSGVSQQRLKQIRVGDEIEFTDPIGTAGDERFRIVTKVEGIRAKGSHKGLIFNSSSVRSLTDFNHQVRLCKVLWKGKQVNVKGTYRPISEFSLKSGGIQTEAEVMQQMIDRGRRAIQKLSDVADQWWQNNSAEGRSAEEPALPPSPPDQVEDSNGAGTKDLGKDSTESDSWYNDAEVALQDRRKIEEERLKTKRRYNPHLSLDQLDVVGKVCKHIHTKSSNDGASVAAILGKISDEYGIPDRKLEALLRGDPERKLSESQVVAHLESLARWLNE